MMPKYSTVENHSEELRDLKRIFTIILWLKTTTKLLQPAVSKIQIANMIANIRSELTHEEVSFLVRHKPHSTVFEELYCPI